MSGQLNKNSASSFNFTKVDITTRSGETVSLGGNSVMGFMYYEDVNSGYISANLAILDSGFNFIANGPIQGGEEVYIEVEGPDEVKYEYNFRVYRVGDRVISKRLQTYNLGLISGEALTNEAVKVNKLLQGQPHEIVQELLQDYIKTDKDLIYDTAANRTVINPSSRSPFSICAYLQDRSFTTQAIKAESQNSSTAKGDQKSLSGSAGYLFYENARGFNFRSIDSLCSLGGSGYENQQEEIKEFFDAPTSNVMGFNHIISVIFESEINLMSGLRLGAYSTKAAFFDINTGQYEEYVYSVDKSFNNQQHLGTNELTDAQKEYAKVPTRIVSAIIDNETHYSGKKPADLLAADNPTPDWTKFTLVQSISRNMMLNTQGLEIEVPGNIDLVVGDKIKVILPNTVDQNQRERERFDTENSGFYLITQLSRFFNASDRKVITTLKLRRDSYGSQE